MTNGTPAGDALVNQILGPLPADGGAGDDYPEDGTDEYEHERWLLGNIPPHHG
jgi:hypothetical protein